MGCGEKGLGFRVEGVGLRVYPARSRRWRPQSPHHPASREALARISVKNLQFLAHDCVGCIQGLSRRVATRVYFDRGLALYGSGSTTRSGSSLARSPRRPASLELPEHLRRVSGAGFRVYSYRGFTLCGAGVTTRSGSSNRELSALHTASLEAPPRIPVKNFGSRVRVYRGTSPIRNSAP